MHTIKPAPTLHPAVESLRATIDSMRTVPPVHNSGLEARLEKLLGQFPRFPGHFIYIFNYCEGRVVYARGSKDVLGYSEEEVTLDLLYRNIHPEDAPVVAHLNERALEAMSMVKNPAELFSLCLTLDYRMRMASGNYRRVLRQTAPFEVDEVSGKVISAFSLCTDITAIKSSNTIGWQVRGFEHTEFMPPETEVKKLRYNPSPREMCVMVKLAEGKSSKIIADEMCISPMTVSTHRRNLLDRTGMKNSAELVRYAMELGWA